MANNHVGESAPTVNKSSQQNDVMGRIDLKGGLSFINNGVGMHTAKNIVICSDGTGNIGGKARGTNGWSIFRGLARSEKDSGGRTIEQVAIYHDGS